MRLKSLKLAGFKSFANPTTFTFKHDITAIVGPNGCGKSNVIDAIRWVLGETSAKQLRGGAMSDVIFAGVEGRAGKSLASVELTFEYTQDETTGIRHALNLYHELTLRRQITKEGKSDYFINGQRVRRRDVVDVFLGTGLGARSYAVIEQGMIGRIVESSPLELRAFIEEAAGVSRYQARRTETQKQLDDAQDNLARLTDLQSELAKQHQMLSVQAQNAQKYQALQQELTQLHKQILQGRVFDAWRQVQHKTAEQHKLNDELSVLNADIAKAQQALQVLSDKLAQNQWLKDDTRNQYHQACLDEQTALHTLLGLEAKIKQCNQKMLELEHSASQADDNITQATSELDVLHKELTDIAPKMTVLEAQREQKQHQLSDLKKQQKQIHTQLDGLGVDKQRLEHEQKSAQRQLERLSLAQQKWQKKHHAWLAEETSFAHHDNDKLKLKTLKEQIDQAQERLDEFEYLDMTGSVAQAQLQVKTLQEHRTQLEKRHATLMGEYQTLHDWLHRPSVPADDGADCDGELAGLDSLQGRVSLTASGQRFAVVLDMFLSFWLEARLTGELPLSHLGYTPKNTKAVLLTAQPSAQSSVQPSEKLDGRLLPLGDLLSPALAVFTGIYLWQGEHGEADYAHILPVLETGAVVLTLSGWLVGRFGMVHMSKFGQTGDFLTQRLAYQQRLDELDEQLGELEIELDDNKQALNVASQHLAGLSVELEERQAQIHAIGQTLRQDEQAYTKLQAQIDQCLLQQANHAKVKLALDEESMELDKEQMEQEQILAQCQQALDELLPHLMDTRQAKETKISKIRQIQDELEADKQAYQRLYLQQHHLSQAQTHAQKLLVLAQESQAQTMVAHQVAHQEQAHLMEQLPQAQETLTQSKQQVAQKHIELQEYEASVQLAQLAQEKQQSELSERQTAHLTLQSHLAKIDANLGLAQSRLDDLTAEMLTIDEHFKLTTWLASTQQAPPILADSHARYQTLKRELEGLGAVNMVAIAELDELEGRLSVMNQQINDITSSIDKLQDAIKTIDNKTKTLFLTMLNAVNAELNALFTKVFAGGQASLSLLDDESLSKADKWRAGLVLMAQPRGKKNSRLAVLSGGEKTLTALSLIFAIFKQHPAPFCVLDEVDAPLDDVNVGRFTSLIGELSSTVQFIFISHNKLAMQTAHELKGITMPVAGISSLVTVNLEEAQQYIES